MRFRSPALYSLAVIMAIPAIACATSIVGIWTKRRITISADSTQTLTQNGITTGSQLSCKIYQVRGLIFALAGLAKAEEISVIDEIRNSRELHDQETGRKLPLESAVVGAESAVARILKARRITSDSNLPVELLIAGEIDGKLQMFRIEIGGMSINGDYSIPTSTRRIAYPESRGYDGTDPARGIEAIGMTETVKKFQKISPEWKNGDDITVSRRLVAIEASDTVASRFVGPPIATIVVDKRGARWVDKGVCDWNPSKPVK